MQRRTLRGMKHVLFVCTHIAGRSQMAEALFNRAAPEDIRAEPRFARLRRLKQLAPHPLAARRSGNVDTVLADARVDAAIRVRRHAREAQDRAVIRLVSCPCRG